MCVCVFFLANFPLSSPLGPHHPTLHLNFSSCCRKRSCFLWVLVVMLSRGLETSLTSSASSMLGEKTDEGLPKFGMPNFSKAWWRKVFWILEGSFFRPSVLASWPICFPCLWPCCCLFPLRAVSYWSIPEHPTSWVWLLLSIFQDAFSNSDWSQELRPGSGLSCRTSHCVIQSKFLSLPHLDEGGRIIDNLAEVFSTIWSKSWNSMNGASFVLLL